MTQTLLLVVLGVAALAAILYPLLRRPPRPAASRARAAPREAEPSDVPDELAELELDFQMGRLSEADFSRLRERVVASSPPPATASRRTVDTEPAPAPAAASAPADLQGRAEAMIRRARSLPRATCPNCGERPEPGARFCSNCGTRLEACPSCGRPLPDAGAKFCPSCGSVLAS